ncbi:MAG TPA: hypothetical protein VHS09_13320 [Polyangiaceae bacterium]|jgi:hypothetical protein|nr:hypothetical protein [Polyangiaceae bacterium]
MAKNELAATAHHEAGHAVASVILGHRFHYVTIEPGDGNLGHVLYPASDRRFRPDESWTPIAERRVRDAILVMLAGYIAEAKFTGRNNWLGSRGDRDGAADLAMRACGSTEEVNAYLAWVDARARSLVRVWWRRIERLAHALLVERRMPQARVVEIVMALDALPPPPRAGKCPLSRRSKTKERGSP